MGFPLNGFIKPIGSVFSNIFGEELEFKLRLSRSIKKIKNSGANWVFCPCGVNPYSLSRGLRIAQACNLPIAAYLVDDFLSGSELSGDTTALHVAQKDIPKWLEEVDQIFVISEGLRSRIQSLYNLDSVVLPLPYDLVSETGFQENDSKLGTDEKQIIYVGNLSHFYIEGLKQIAQIIDEINNNIGSNIKLRFTLPNMNEIKSLIGNYDCIKCSPCIDNRDLQQEIHSSILCFAPYSFQEKYKIMVSTSFPSKLLDYLSAARLILVLGPDYASSVIYFKKNRLKTCLTKQDPEMIRAIIIQQLNENTDYSNAYREVLQKNHNPREVALQVISTLKSHHT
ncbi:glycosyltransferase family protein [Methanosarcina lacustris]|nr:hypothetical protein [Methanosarcina lacustris]